MLKERVMFLKRKKNKRENPYLFISVVFNMPQMNLVTYVLFFFLWGGWGGCGGCGEVKGWDGWGKLENVCCPNLGLCQLRRLKIFLKRVKTSPQSNGIETSQEKNCNILILFLPYIFIVLHQHTHTHTRTHTYILFIHHPNFINFICSEYCDACSLYISCKEIKGRSHVQKENFQDKNLKPKILKP